jgi:prepilin-type N-terminal cleavage/methylation domain-containing protein
MNTRVHTPRAEGAFTLIEIMLVVGILAIVMAMAAPPIYRGIQKEPLRKTLVALQEAFRDAREAAIINGKVAKVVFHPLDRTFAAEGVSAGRTAGAREPGVIPDSIGVEMLDINLREFREADVAEVRFFPNGTCDEFTLILHSDRGEWRKITLESTTGIYEVGDVR